jgi:hypothetical protein
MVDDPINRFKSNSGFGRAGELHSTAVSTLVTKDRRASSPFWGSRLADSTTA